MNQNQFEQQWLELAKKDAETDPYEKDILDIVMQIIDDKEYRHLFYIMRNYDGLVKAIGDRIQDIDKVDRTTSYWSQVFGFGGKIEQ